MNIISKRFRIIILNIAIIMFLGIGLGTSLAYLTSTDSVSQTFKMGEVKGMASYKVNNVTNNLATFSIVDLAYIDILNDYKNPDIFNSLATYIDVEVTNTATITDGNISVRTKVEVLDNNNSANIEGLVYLVIPDINDNTKNTAIKDINNNILYSTLFANILSDSTYTPSGATIGSYTTDQAYQAIQNYNKLTLEEFYEGTSRILPANGGTASFRVAFFGNYYGLTDTTNYLTKSYNLKMKVVLIQNIDNYGGPDYETDN